ncbi:MAG: hypothetical protein GX174_05295 [Lentisphaerae bacterium]|nr:hypothetical protein [Lentisphaerota bacterium]
MISNREKVMLVITLLAILYGALGLTLRGRLERLRAQRDALREQQTLLADREALVAQRASWEAQYAELQDLMPVFDQNRRVDTYWLGIMDRVAAKNNFSIIKPQVGEEKLAGDVYEMPIDCKDWEGSLEGLVGFLYDLQAEGAMLDVRSMFIRPVPNKPALLRGSFTLYCAYLREASDNAASASGERTP